MFNTISDLLASKNLVYLICIPIVINIRAIIIELIFVLFLLLIGQNYYW